tara:strand:+ start:282 stop:527 length:246 start_codon:yes stop_codon:yes gene_type:complete
MIVSNGDMPINPITMDNGHPYHASQVCFENTPLVSGLTKREAFAMAAMQGILSHSFGRGNPDELADQSIKCADALLKELAK